jgi:hypothetical protein
LLRIGQDPRNLAKKKGEREMVAKTKRNTDKRHSKKLKLKKETVKDLSLGKNKAGAVKGGRYCDGSGGSGHVGCQ